MFVPVHPNQSTSPFAMELGQKLDTVVRDYRGSHPGISNREIRDAFRIAEASSGVGAFRRFMPSFVPVAIAAGLFAEALGSRGWRHNFPPIPLFLVALAVLAAVVLIRLARR